MKKSSFIALVLGTVSGVLFAIGMCMALIPEWNAFKPGIVLGAIGAIMGIITYFVWRKMAGKGPVEVHLTKKAVLSILLGIVGVLALGIGMCFVMVWKNILVGIVVGLLGIVALLVEIPLVKGLE